MKKTLAFLGAAAAALMMSAPAQADSGYIGLAYQGNDPGNSVGDLESYSLTGAAAFGENFQVDGHYASYEGDANSFGVGGHAFQRSEGGLIGVYLGANRWDDDTSTFDADEWTAAAQFQKYLSSTTFSGNVVYNNSNGDLGAFGNIGASSWGADGEARQFLTDNFSMQGNLGYYAIEFDGAVSSNFYTAGAGAEYQIDGAPISIHAGYQHTDFENGGEVHSMGVGVRFGFGGGTLKDRSQSGAGLSRPRSLLEHATGGVSPR